MIHTSKTSGRTIRAVQKEAEEFSEKDKAGAGVQTSYAQEMGDHGS